MRASQFLIGVATTILLIDGPVCAPPVIEINQLFQQWSRSYEEEQPSQAVQVFRPTASKAFPPSRFRMVYTFARNGTCEYYVLSPDDSHQFDACTFSVVKTDKARLQIKEAEATTDFKIVELSEKVLRLEPSQ